MGRKVEDDGSIYKGNFSEGVKKGLGIQLFANYDVFRGEWNDDKPNGKGTYYYHNLQTFIEGPFKDGQPDSQGNFKIRYGNGDVYEGGMLNRKKSGKGKLYYSNGDLYEGEFIYDKKEGKGKFYIKSEDI